MFPKAIAWHILCAKHHADVQSSLPHCRLKFFNFLFFNRCMWRIITRIGLWNVITQRETHLCGFMTFICWLKDLINYRWIYVPPSGHCSPKSSLSNNWKGLVPSEYSLVKLRVINGYVNDLVREGHQCATGSTRGTWQSIKTVTDLHQIRDDSWTVVEERHEAATQNLGYTDVKVPWCDPAERICFDLVYFRPFKATAGYCCF